MYKKIGYGLLVMGIIATCFTLLTYFRWSQDELLHLYFFDVGQGDGFLVITPDKQIITIDGGPGNSFTSKVSDKIPFYQKLIDVSILSHPHADHLTGFLELSKSYGINTFYHSGLDYASSEVNYLDRIVSQYDILSNNLYQGQQLKVGQVLLDVVWPPSNYQCENINDCSLVIRLQYKDFCTYFMGDATTEVLDQINVNQCDLLKLSHQGAKDSLNESFLSRVSPLLTIISVGENNYGHPNPETIEMLNKNRIEFLRTDLSGDIEILSDGNKFWIGN